VFLLPCKNFCYGQIARKSIAGTNIFITILILSILLLIPDQSIFALGVEVLIADLIVWIFTLRMDLSIYKKTENKFREFYLYNVCINQLPTIPYVISGIFLLNDNTNGLYFAITGFILCFIKAIMDSWVLLEKLTGKYTS